MVQRITSSNYFINLVKSELMKSDETRLKKFSEELIHKNAALGEKPDGFFYRGHVFYNVDPKLYSVAAKGNLNPLLYDEGDMLVRQLDKTKRDGDKIQQYMALCFIGAQDPQTLKWTLQDIRDVLHEGIVDLVPELRSLKRTRPEGYCMVEPFRTQWIKLRATIEEYIAMRFFT